MKSLFRRSLKDFFRDRETFVPFRTTQPRVVDQLGHGQPCVRSLELQCEKLLYRIQQLERREKGLLSTQASLKREITALKRAKPTKAPSRLNPPERVQETVPRQDTAPTDSDGPDFSLGLAELN